jgi:cell division septation protein DedD
MICQQFEELAPQIARNELRDAKLLQDAINHAASCVDCDATLVEARELAASVASLAAHDKALDSAAHLEFTLRAAFAREHAANMPSRSSFIAEAGLPSARFARFGWHVFALAGAAAIVAMLLFPRVLDLNSGTDRVGVRPAQSSSPALVATTASVKSAPTTQALAPVTQKRFTASRKPKKNPEEPEKTLTGFMALPYADDLSTIQYGAIVRLQLSRADLAWYGLPVPISDSGQKITADLFVNGSGTPEAIRLVR